MESDKLNEIIDSSYFIDDSLKERCKDYFKQTHKALGYWFYSYKPAEDTYQGDIIDELDLVYFEVVNDVLETKVLEDQPCMLLSHTCDMYLQGKTRGKYISVAPLFSYREFSNRRTEGYSDEGWGDFLEAVKRNRITDILYIPEKQPLGESVILLDRIFPIDPNFLKAKLEKRGSKKILSLSQIGFYYLLIKLTYHFARYEDRAEIKRE